MIREKIKQALSQAIKKSGFLQPDSIVVEIPREKKFGDYSSNVAMVLAGKSKKNPQKIAQKIANNFSLKNVKTEIISSFINFKIKENYLRNLIPEILKAKDKFGHSNLGKDFQVNIEFISANPTGPLTLGNGRGGFCGDVLARVFEAFGCRVEREYFVNDRGNQIEALGHSILKDSQTVYKGDYLDRLYRKLKVKNEKLKIIGQWAAEEILNHYIKKTIRDMNIKMDKYFSEQSLYNKKEVEKFLGLLEEKGYVEKKEGAIWFTARQFADEKDRVLQKKNGEFTYFASDIAYHADKIKRGYDLCINFWGADHAGYVSRMEAAVEEVLKKELNWTGKFKIIIFQLVRLIKGGREIKMSKRKGNVVYLDELLKEVGKDAARFFFLMHSYNTHMTFDLNLAKKKSQENPVYYVQYAHARIQSILAKSQISRLRQGFGGQANLKSQTDLSLLKHPAELNLIRELIRLPNIAEEIIADYQVHRLPFYAISLADAFHNFYEKCRVIDSKNKNLTQARLALCQATQIVLKNTLSLMGISAPKKM